MPAEHPDLHELLAAINALPPEWHGSGSVTADVLNGLRRHCGRLGHSMETGTGRTTLLLSHLSDRHVVFTKDDAGDGDSLSAVQTSSLLRKDSVEFVVGPTQRTLLNHRFTAPLDLAYLDGPHAYPFPELEYWAVYPHVATGGLLVVDDIQIPTIDNMFRFLRRDAMWDLLEVVDTTAFFRRTTSPLIDPYGEGWWLQAYNAKPRITLAGQLKRVTNKARSLTGRR